LLARGRGTLSMLANVAKDAPSRPDQGPRMVKR
jgi:hypothetical protein